MNLNKHLEFFNPLEVKAPVHIIGLGAIGSHLCMLLIRLGLEDFYLYDFDTVEDKNLANQQYFFKDIETRKTDSLIENMHMVNPRAKINTFDKGYSTQALFGYVFLAVDNIELRHKIAKDNQYNPNIKAMFDYRMGLDEAQHYATEWGPEHEKTMANFLSSMAFTQKEGEAVSPVSACGTTLAVIPTIQTITALGIANFINLIKGRSLKNVIIMNAFTFDILTF